MIGGVIKAKVRPGKKAALLDFLKWDGKVAQDEEPATVRFDVFEDSADDSTVYWYEAYVDEAGFEAHKANPPFQKFASGLKDECIESMEIVFWGQAV